MNIEEFDYQLPPEAIAQAPRLPRDAARLLDTGTMSDRVFSDLDAMLEPGDVMVVNDTRVRAARLAARKEPSGGRVEVLLAERLDDQRWRALARPSRRLRPGTRLRAGDIAMEVLTHPEEGMVTMVLSSDREIEEAIAATGTVPLPPYIKAEGIDPELYQTVYATAPASAAAPTAGLHFTPELLARIEAAGVLRCAVELRVGIGTFRPITAARVEDHRMHAEWVSVPPSTVEVIEEARAAGRRVVAVGTTVVRALESRVEDGRLRAGSGHTDLFIRPGHRFAVVDRLITNFHLPRSSLVVMVAAFMGPRWRHVYQEALRRGYRFLSFGDAMIADRESA